MSYKQSFALLFLIGIIAVAIAACSSDAITDSLSLQYNSATVTIEKQQGKSNVSANLVVRMVNRTEHSMNIAFVEGTIYDAQTNRALVQFRPIIPDSYGSISTGQLLPKQVKDFSVVTPQGLDGSDVASASMVVVKLDVQTTDGYRAEVVSAPTTVLTK